MATTNEAVEDTLRLVVTILALLVFVIALLAYRRQRTRRILLLCFAFGFYVAKGLLLSIDFLVGEVPFIDYVGEAGDAVFLLLILAAFLQA